MGKWAAIGSGIGRTAKLAWKHKAAAAAVAVKVAAAITAVADVFDRRNPKSSRRRR